MEPSQGGFLQAGWEHFAQKMIVSYIQYHHLVKIQHVIIWVIRAIIHGKRRYDKAAGWGGRDRGGGGAKGDMTKLRGGEGGTGGGGGGGRGGAGLVSQDVLTQGG